MEISDDQLKSDLIQGIFCSSVNSHFPRQSASGGFPSAGPDGSSSLAGVDSTALAAAAASGPAASALLHSTASQPLSTASQPLSTASQPLSTAAQPLSTASQPLSTAAQPLKLMESLDDALSSVLSAVPHADGSANGVDSLSTCHGSLEPRLASSMVDCSVGDVNHVALDHLTGFGSDPARSGDVISDSLEAGADGLVPADVIHSAEPQSNGQFIDLAEKATASFPVDSPVENIAADANQPGTPFANTFMVSGTFSDDEFFDDDPVADPAVGEDQETEVEPVPSLSEAFTAGEEQQHEDAFTGETQSAESVPEFEDPCSDAADGTMIVMDSEDATCKRDGAGDSAAGGDSGDAVWPDPCESPGMNDSVVELETAAGPSSSADDSSCVVEDCGASPQPQPSDADAVTSAAESAQQPNIDGADVIRKVGADAAEVPSAAVSTGIETRRVKPGRPGPARFKPPAEKTDDAGVDDDDDDIVVVGMVQHPSTVKQNGQRPQPEEIRLDDESSADEGGSKAAPVDPRTAQMIRETRRIRVAVNMRLHNASLRTSQTQRRWSQMSRNREQARRDYWQCVRRQPTPPPTPTRRALQATSRAFPPNYSATQQLLNVANRRAGPKSRTRVAVTPAAPAVPQLPPEYTPASKVPSYCRSTFFRPDEVISVYLAAKQGLQNCFINMDVDNSCLKTRLPPRPRAHGMCFCQVYRRDMEPQCVMTVTDRVYHPPPPASGQSSGAEDPANQRNITAPAAVAGQGNKLQSQCSLCRMWFDSAQRLKLHTPNCIRNRAPAKSVSMKPFCERCGIPFSSTPLLNQHLLAYHNDLGLNVSFQCPLCPSWFSTMVPFKKHLLGVHGPGANGAFRCPMCPRHWCRNEANAWCVHIAVSHVTSQRKTNPPTLPAVAAAQAAQKQSAASPVVVSEVACPICRRWKGTLTNLKPHVMALHRKLGTLANVCPLCGVQSGSANEWYYHVVGHLQVTGGGGAAAASRKRPAAVTVLNAPLAKRAATSSASAAAFTCPKCKMRFNDVSLFPPHWTAMHSDSMPTAPAAVQAPRRGGAPFPQSAQRSSTSMMRQRPGGLAAGAARPAAARCTKCGLGCVSEQALAQHWVTSHTQLHLSASAGVQQRQRAQTPQLRMRMPAAVRPGGFVRMRPPVQPMANRRMAGPVRRRRPVVGQHPRGAVLRPDAATIASLIACDVSFTEGAPGPSAGLSGTVLTDDSLDQLLSSIMPNGSGEN